MSQSSQPLDVESIRNEFPIFAHHQNLGKPLIYLDSGASAEKPRQVIDTEMRCYEQYYANAYRGVYRLGARVDEELEQSRAFVQQLVRARSSQEIIFTSGTTMSINLVAFAWGRKFLQPGDEIVVNLSEHHANLVPWQQAAKATGAQLKYFPLTDDGQLDLSQIDNVITAKTKIVAVASMSNVLGTIHPIKQLAQAAHKQGALIFVDAAQGVAHLHTNVIEDEIDFLAFSGHKLYGPSGVGVLYGRKDLLEEMDPFLTGGHMISQVKQFESTWAELPAKFEAGTLPIAQAIALGAAIEYVLDLGIEQIAEHEKQLTRYAYERLQEVLNLTVYGPTADNRGSILSFSIERAHPQDIAALLDRHGIAVRHGHHCAMLLHEWLGISASTRASFGVYNSTDDVDALIEGLLKALKKLRLL